MPLRVGSFARLSGAKEMEETILRMARQRRTDQQTAQCLTSCGYRSSLGDAVLPNTVSDIRRKHGICLTPLSTPPNLPIALA